MSAAVAVAVQPIIDAKLAAIEALHRATALYTRAPIVDKLLAKIAWPMADHRLVDPSCGDGIFLARALEILLEKRPGIADDDIPRVIEGWEIYGGAVEHARERIADVLATAGRPRAAARMLALRIVRHGDFLTDGPDTPTYHAIAGNPPYLRFVNVPEVLREIYLSIVPRHARNDLLHTFLDRCTSALHQGGEIALVTADRWLFNFHAASLRETIGGRLSIHHLERLDASTVFYRPKDRRVGTPPRIHPVAIVLGAPSAGNVIQLTRAPVYPDRLTAPVGASATTTLEDIANVRIAPWLGSAGIFVVDAEMASRFPSEFLVPAIDTDDVVGGVLGTPKRFALKTHPKVEPPSVIAEHLLANRHRMCKRGRKRKQYWLPPETWHRLDLSREMLLVPRIARSLKPVRVPAGILPINHNLSIVAAGTSTLDEIEELLRSPEAEEWVRDHAPRLENGFYSLTTKILRKLPVFQKAKSQTQPTSSGSAELAAAAAA